MGHYLRAANGKFYYNPTIKRSTLLRDYERTKPIRPKIAGKRRRTWQRKVKRAPPKKGIYEYTVYSSETGPEGRQTTFEGRTTMEIDEDDDPYSKKNMRKAKARIRRGYDRLYMEQIGEILDDPEVSGVRRVPEMMRGVEVGTIRQGRMYRSIEGKPVEKLVGGAWRQTSWVKRGGKWTLKLVPLG